MIPTIIDGSAMRDREGAHAELARALKLPEYYGANLDALWDLVSTMKCDAVLINAADLLNGLNVYGCKLIQTLFEAAEENPDFKFRLA